MGNETEMFVKYMIRRAETIRKAGVWPILVFDGEKVPLKVRQEIFMIHALTTLCLESSVDGA
jgi:hypothetical protein